MQKIKKAVILLAGYGTRCLPVSKVLPKAMIAILNKPIIHYIIEEIEQSGFEEVIFVLPKSNGKLIKDYFSKNKVYEKFLTSRKNSQGLEKLNEIKTNLKTSFVYASPNGSGGAVLKIKKLVKDQPFAVLNGDDLFFGKTTPLSFLADKYAKTQSNVIGVQEVNKKDVGKYGIVEADKSDLVTKIIEKPKANQTKSTLACLGRYIFTPEIFDALKKITPQPNGELLLTDAISILVSKGKVYSKKMECEHFDGGNEKEILLCGIKLGMQKGYADEIIKLINSQNTED